MTERLRLWRARLAFAVLIWVHVERVWLTLFWLLLDWAGPVLEAEIARRKAAGLDEVRAVLRELMVK